MRRLLALALAVAVACGPVTARPLKGTRGAGGGGCGANKSLALSWDLPTTMTDASAIGTNTGTKVYYDTVSRQGTHTAYANSVGVGDGTSTTYTLTCLAASTTYYISFTVTVGGIESAYSNEVSATTAP